MGVFRLEGVEQVTINDCKFVNCGEVLRAKDCGNLDFERSEVINSGRDLVQRSNQDAVKPIKANWLKSSTSVVALANGVASFVEKARKFTE